MCSSVCVQVLSGRHKGGYLTGEILINGKRPCADFKRVVRLIQNDDIHLPTLTVQETVLFSCRLRTDREQCHVELRPLMVDLLLKQLGCVPLQPFSSLPPVPCLISRLFAPF